MWSKDIDEVLKELNTKETGITEREAEKRLLQNGKNEISKQKKNTVFNIFIEQFKSPIILILIVAAIFASITKSTADCIFILVVITINAVIGSYQEWSSEKSAEKLQNMIKMKTKVLRNGKLKVADSEEIVLRRYCSVGIWR